MPAGKPARGFTYVAMLFALALFGVGLAALGEAWSARSARDKEDELVQVAGQYVRAIRSYYLRAPGSVKTFPPTLQELLDDRRFVGTERHLRALYRDPVADSPAWGLVRAPDGGIMGIYSLSDKPCLRAQPLTLPDSLPVTGARYSDWKFVVRLPEAGR